MALAALVYGDHFELGFVRSSDNSAGKAKQLVQMNGSYRTRKLDMNGMGSNADVNNLGLLTMLGNTKTLTLCGEVMTYENLRTREQQLKIDLVRSFGSDIAQMSAFVQEVMVSLGSASPLSQEQKDNLFTMVSEIVTLKNLMNIGTLPDGQARLEILIAKTATDIAKNLLEGMDNQSISAAIINFVHTMLVDVQNKYDIPTLNESMIKIEGRMNPQNYLANSIAEMISQLGQIIDNQDLSEEAKAELEALKEKLEGIKDGNTPLDRETLKSLNSLSEKFPDITLSKEFSLALETLKDANIVLKAEILGLSVTQLQSAETAIETLSNNLSNSSNNDQTELETTIKKLIEFADNGSQLDKQTLKSLEKLAVHYPKIETHSFSSTIAILKSVGAGALGFISSPFIPTTNGSQPKIFNAPDFKPFIPAPINLNTPPVIPPVIEIRAQPSNPAPVNPRTPETDIISAPPSPPVVVTPKEIPESPNPDVPKTGKKPTPETPKDPDTSPEGKKPEQVKPAPENPPSPEGEKPKPENPTKQEGCEGVCKCKDAFNNVSIKGNDITFTDPSTGKIVIMTPEQQKQYADTELKKLDPIIRNNIPPEMQKDPKILIEYLVNQRKIEVENNNFVKTENITPTNDKIQDDALKRKLDEMANRPPPPPPPKTPPIGPVRDYPSAKDPFHKCGPNCNHGPAGKPATPDNDKAQVLTDPIQLTGFQGKSRTREPK